MTYSGGVGELLHTFVLAGEVVGQRHVVVTEKHLQQQPLDVTTRRHHKDVRNVGDVHAYACASMLSCVRGASVRACVLCVKIRFHE